MVKKKKNSPREALFFRGAAKGVHVGSLDVRGGLDVVRVRHQVRQS